MGHLFHVTVLLPTLPKRSLPKPPLVLRRLLSLCALVSHSHCSTTTPIPCTQALVSVDSIVMSLLYSQNTLTFVPLASKVNQREGKLFMRMPILHLVLESLCSRGSYLKLALKSFTKFLLNTSARHRCNRKTRTTLCDQQFKMLISLKGWLCFT